MLAIPDREYKDRIRKFQRNIREAGLDAGLVHANEADSANVRYLSEYWPTFESAGVFVPATGSSAVRSCRCRCTRASARSSPHVKLYKADETLIVLRIDKSANEIKLMKRAFQISALAVEAILNEMKPGMTELGRGALPRARCGILVKC